MVKGSASELGQLPRLWCESGQLRLGNFVEIFRITNPGEWVIIGKLGGWEERHTSRLKWTWKNSWMLLPGGPGPCWCMKRMHVSIESWWLLSVMVSSWEAVSMYLLNVIEQKYQPQQVLLSLPCSVHTVCTSPASPTSHWVFLSCVGIEGHMSILFTWCYQLYWGTSIVWAFLPSRLEVGWGYNSGCKFTSFWTCR